MPARISDAFSSRAAIFDEGRGAMCGPRRKRVRDDRVPSARRRGCPPNCGSNQTCGHIGQALRPCVAPRRIRTRRLRASAAHNKGSICVGHGELREGDSDWGGGNTQDKKCCVVGSETITNQSCAGAQKLCAGDSGCAGARSPTAAPTEAVRQTSTAPSKRAAPFRRPGDAGSIARCPPRVVFDEEVRCPISSARSSQQSIA